MPGSASNVLQLLDIILYELVRNLDLKVGGARQGQTGKKERCSNPNTDTEACLIRMCVCMN